MSFTFWLWTINFITLIMLVLYIVFPAKQFWSLKYCPKDFVCLKVNICVHFYDMSRLWILYILFFFFVSMYSYNIYFIQNIIIERVKFVLTNIVHRFSLFFSHKKLIHYKYLTKMYVWKIVLFFYVFFK